MISCPLVKNAIPFVQNATSPTGHRELSMTDAQCNVLASVALSWARKQNPSGDKPAS